MARRVGGLVISRKLGESIQMRYPDNTIRIIYVDGLKADGAVIRVSDDPKPYDMVIGDSVALEGLDQSSSGLYLESVEGGRCALRIIADDRIRVLRSELLR